MENQDLKIESHIVFKLIRELWYKRKVPTELLKYKAEW